jgi:hypothetical protein
MLLIGWGLHVHLATCCCIYFKIFDRNGYIVSAVVLYLPVRAVAKARILPADVIVIYFEDAVGPDAKVTARNQVLRSLAEGFTD